MNLQAVIFDMDGVILDTERLVRRCWNKAGAQLGLADIDCCYLAQIGTTRAAAAELLHARYGADFSTADFLAASREYFYEEARRDGIPLRPHAREALEACRTRGLRVGLASSTRQHAVEEELGRAGVLDLFDAVLGGDRIAVSKPAPDIYLAACDLLSVEPRCAIAVEDSYNGIRAAHAAGMLPVMVPDLLPPTKEMEQLSHSILSDLSNLSMLLDALA